MMSDRKTQIMDVRSPLASLGLCAALLMGSGCSPSDEHKQASLEEKTAKFEQSLDAIQDPKLKDAVSDLAVGQALYLYLDHRSSLVAIFASSA